MPPEVHAGNGVSHDGQSSEGISTAHRLYDLLDTLVAMRLDVGDSAKGDAAAATLGPDKIHGIRDLLDCAIASTKEIIDGIARPQIG